MVAMLDVERDLLSAARVEVTSRDPDRGSVAAIAAAVYFVATMVHEVIGHAGAARLLGAPVSWCTNAGCGIGLTGLPAYERRIIAAAGCAANVMFGTLAGVVCRAVSQSYSRLRFTLWLFATLNWLFAAGYLMVFSLMPAGDGSEVFTGLPFSAAWRVTGVVVGLFLSRALLRMARWRLDSFLPTSGDRRGVAIALTSTPYGVGGIVNAVAVALADPSVALLISAIASTFGGAYGLRVLGHSVSDLASPGADRASGIGPSRLAYVAGAAAIVAYAGVAVMGRAQ